MEEEGEKQPNHPCMLSSLSLPAQAPFFFSGISLSPTAELGGRRGRGGGYGRERERGRRGKLEEEEEAVLVEVALA